jgi:NAD+ synthase
MVNLAEQISGWMRQQAHAAGARGFVVGLSGGIDSAVVVGLATRAWPGHVAGVIMPCHSDPRDEADARLAAERFSVPIARVDLEPVYDALASSLQQAVGALPPDQVAGGPAEDIRSRVPLANIKPRLRMTSLFYVANSLNYLVAGTGNRSEIVIGYYTKYGDGGVDLLPLGRLFKSQVRALALELQVPKPVIDKTPSAGLWLGQTDEGEMGFSYDDLERYLTGGAASTPPAVAQRIERLVRASGHKRALPPIPDLG